ncbi:MAG: nucleotide pyrophosphohydrolase [Desulfobacterales bacterium]|jgi:dCTP diphosphatase
MKEIVAKLRTFADEREWAKFHSPKNLAMALSVEAAEIVEHFQWLTQAQSYELSPDKLEKVRDEIGDVYIYLTMLADKLGIDPLEAALEKIEKNEKNYPADLVRGKSKKYKEY